MFCNFDMLITFQNVTTGLLLHCIVFASYLYLWIYESLLHCDGEDQAFLMLFLERKWLVKMKVLITVCDLSGQEFLNLFQVDFCKIQRVFLSSKTGKATILKAANPHSLKKNPKVQLKKIVFFLSRILNHSD